MKTACPILSIAVITLANAFAATPARADDVSYKPIVDAEARMARTPYHEVAIVDGKPFEKIYTTTTLSVRLNNGGRCR